MLWQKPDRHAIGAVAIFAVIALILLMIAMPNYMRVSDRTGHAGLTGRMTLDSGVDKKSGRASSGTGATHSSGSGYAEEDRTAAAGRVSPSPSPGGSNLMAPSTAAWTQPTEAEGFISRALAAAGVDELRLQSWFIPTAYAADHEIDQRYMVRTGECEIEVENYKSAAKEIGAIARKHEGMISDTHSQRHGDDSFEGWITLRVPSDKFDQAWADVLAVGEVFEEQIGTDDVSKQYVGYVSRLKNLMAEQAVLQKMLDEALAVQRSRGLGEGYSILLDTQERLFAVTDKIESTEDQLNALADLITRSTITVHLREQRKLPAQVQQVTEEFSWGFGATAGDAYTELLIRIRGIGQALIYFLITCWTWLIPLALFIWFGTWVYRRWLAPRFEEMQAGGPSGSSGPPAATPPGDG